MTDPRPFSPKSPRADPRSQPDFFWHCWCQLCQLVRVLKIAAAALLALLPLAAAAQQASTLHDRAIAAGYKAAMLCSGIFDAEDSGITRTRASIEANELKGIYPEYDSLIAGLPAEIRSDRVLVRYDPG